MCVSLCRMTKLSEGHDSAARGFVKRWLCWLIAAALLCGGIFNSSAATAPAPPATNNPPTATNSTPAVTNSAPTAPPATNAAAIPMREVALQAETAFATLRSLDDYLAPDPAVEAITNELPVLTAELNARVEESSRILASSPSLESLRRLSREWGGVREELTAWKKVLTRQAAQLEEEMARLTQLEKTWAATRAAVENGKAPQELQDQVGRVIKAAQTRREKADAQQALLLTLLTRVTQQDGRTIHTLNTIERAREEVVSHIFTRDSPPIWSQAFWSGTGSNLVEQSQSSVSRQTQTLRAYFDRNQDRFILHAIILLALFGGLVWMGRALHDLGGDEARQAALVFDAPFPTALVLSLLVSSWIYPQAPRMLWAILGAAALVPAIFVLRRLIDRRIFPVLNALVVFYFVDQLRILAASEPVLLRLLFLSEALAGAAFTGWLMWSARLSGTIGAGRFGKWARAGCRITLAWFIIALLGNALGYQILGKLLGHALLSSGYLALILYAGVRIIDGLVFSAMSIPPLDRLGLVRNHRALLRSHALSLLRWCAMLLWTVFILEALAVRAPLFQDLHELLTARLVVGAFKLSLGDVLLFSATVWAAFFTSRILRFVLEGEVYPRVQLAPGLHYSISKMVNYLVLVGGFMIGVTMLGFDMTRLTILVGAFGVGLGFGMQNIINNFVSGLILLFERPIKVGDVIQIEGNEGVVRQIGIRASIVRVPNGSEIIVPNGKLISDTVTNWTFSDKLRRIDIPLAVAAPADAAHVMELLRQIAEGHPLVIKDPPAKALFLGFAGGVLNFDLRCWSNQPETCTQIRSDLGVAINATLTKENLAIK